MSNCIFVSNYNFEKLFKTSLGIVTKTFTIFWFTKDLNKKFDYTTFIHLVFFFFTYLIIKNVFIVKSILNIGIVALKFVIIGNNK